jgi:hypothetical protein
MYTIKEIIHNESQNRAKCFGDIFSQMSKTDPSK